MGKSKEGHPRRRYLINPRFQLTLIGYNLAASLLIGLVFYGAVRLFFWKLAAFGHEAGLAANHVFFQFIAEQLRLMNFVALGTFAVVTVILSLHGLFLSHRIAGPLYRLRMHMLSAAKGEEPKPLRFRNKDFFPELAEAYNQQIAVKNDRKAA